MKKIRKDTDGKESIDYLEKLFMSKGISAYVFIPQIGTFSFINSGHGKLSLVEHANIEVQSYNLAVKKLAEDWTLTRANKESKNEIKDIPEYLR